MAPPTPNHHQHHTPHKFPLERTPVLTDELRRTELLPLEPLLGQLEPWLARPGAVVADVGAGPGYVAVEIAGRYPNLRVVATDIQPAMLELLAERAQKAGLAAELAEGVGAGARPRVADRLAAAPEGRGRLVCALNSEAELPLPDGSVDLLLLVNVLHELIEPKPFLAEVARSLKPSSGLNANEDDKDDKEGEGREGVLAVIDWQKEEMDHGPPLHARLTVEEATEWLAELAGFREVGRFDCGDYQWGLLLAPPNDHPSL